jgi:hypothetical protein
MAFSILLPCIHAPRSAARQHRRRSEQCMRRTNSKGPDRHRDGQRIACAASLPSSQIPWTCLVLPRRSGHRVFAESLDPRTRFDHSLSLSLSLVTLILITPVRTDYLKTTPSKQPNFAIPPAGAAVPRTKPPDRAPNRPPAPPAGRGTQHGPAKAPAPSCITVALHWLWMDGNHCPVHPPTQKSSPAGRRGPAAYVSAWPTSPPTHPPYKASARAHASIHHTHTDTPPHAGEPVSLAPVPVRAT